MSALLLFEGSVKAKLVCIVEVVIGQALLCLNLLERFWSFCRLGISPAPLPCYDPLSDTAILLHAFRHCKEDNRREYIRKRTKFHKQPTLHLLLTFSL